VEIIEKSFPLNLINIIVEVGVIWITYSRSLELDYCHYLIGGSDRWSSSKVRKASILFILVSYFQIEPFDRRFGYDYQWSSLSYKSDWSLSIEW